MNCTVTYKGSCPPDVYPLDGEPRKMKYNFAGYAVVFRANHGRSHCTYLRGCSQERALSYAASEGAAIGSQVADVWEVHAIPYNAAIDWKEEGLP
jgi:hypothetical protein